MEALHEDSYSGNMYNVGQPISQYVLCVFFHLKVKFPDYSMHHISTQTLTLQIRTLVLESSKVPVRINDTHLQEIITNNQI